MLNYVDMQIVTGTSDEARMHVVMSNTQKALSQDRSYLVQFLLEEKESKKIVL